MTLGTFTLPPDNRSLGSGNPPQDMNGVVDALTASGVPFNLMNSAYGAADPTGTNDCTAIIGLVIAAAVTAGRPVKIPGGTFKVNSTLNWKVAGLHVIGEGSALTKIVQSTTGIPIVQVAGQGQRIEGITFTYTSQQGSGNPGGICMEFGDDTVGSSFESEFSDIYCELGYTGLAVNPAITTAAGLFSCHFDNLHVLGYYLHGIGMTGNAGGGLANCTGCVFDNTYIHNNYSGSPAPANSYPLYLAQWDEVVFNQLNIEHGESFISDLIGLSGVGNCVINALHLEGMQLSGSSGNAGYINLDGRSSCVVNGMTIRFGTMTGSTDNPVVRFSGSGPSTAIINGFNEGSENTFSHAHPWADFGSVPNCVMEVSGVISSLVTAQSINAGAGCMVQAGPATGFSGVFGDGSDGTATLDGTATVAWASLAGSTYTMSRSAHLTGLTVNSGITLKPVGWAIYCRGIVTNNGTISADGVSASVGTAGGSSGSAYYFGGRGGGTGTTGAGAAGSGASVGVGAAGIGGVGSSGAAGAAGTVINTSTQFFKLPIMIFMGYVPQSYNANTSAISGGPGGGSGGGDGTNVGGGGGGGGGPIIIFAFAFINGATGTLSSKGGTGGTPSAGNCGSGGGGSGGPVLVFTLGPWLQSGTITLTAGPAGAKTGTGTVGASGSAGFSLNQLVA
jgi:hypothetical protein